MSNYESKLAALLSLKYIEQLSRHLDSHVVFPHKKLLS